MNLTTTFIDAKFETTTFCGQEFITVRGQSWTPPERTEPTTGVHDYKTCENCLSIHKQMIDILQNTYDKMPYCCEYHTKIAKKFDLDKSEIFCEPSMYADKVIFTKQHIINNIDASYWYNDITEYIEYTVMSFGSADIRNYFVWLKHLLNNGHGLQKNKKDAIITYLEGLESKKHTDTSDFNILKETYKKWFDLFPFELSFFKDLKAYFWNNPVLGTETIYNRYSNFERTILFTKEGLINFLENTTNELITQINIRTSCGTWELTDVQKVQKEMMLAAWKVEDEKGFLSAKADEKDRYISILKQWFKREKKRLKELETVLRAVAPAAPVPTIKTAAHTVKKENEAVKQNLFCPSMPLSVPIDYFRLFTTDRNNKGEPYLSVADLDKFIDRAFCGNADMEKLKLNYDAQNYVISIFYNFYLFASKEHESTSQCKDKYINLLCDNFISFDFRKVKNNFRRTH